jgi:hypothetical protein
MSSDSKVYFMTFGGGRVNFHAAVNRLCAQAKSFDLFEDIYGFTEKDLMTDTIFWDQHSKFILENARGFGFWIWKSFLIRKTLEKINDGDILFYTDCGCELNIHGKPRFLEYLELVHKNDILTFNLTHKEKTWTKMDLMKHFNLTDDQMNSGQIASTCIFLKKTDSNIDLVKEWEAVCLLNNYSLVNNSPSKLPNDSSFRENRHDQSVLSCLIKKYDKFNIPDDTYYLDWSEGRFFPILSLRNKTGNSLLKF